jgi:hypothetical protein
MKYSLRSLTTISIRDLLWLTFVVGMFVAWTTDRAIFSKRIRELNDQNVKLNDQNLLLVKRANARPRILPKMREISETEAEIVDRLMFHPEKYRPDTSP